MVVRINTATRVLNVMEDDTYTVTQGTLANNTARAANRTAINNIIQRAASERKKVYFPPGDYEIHGGAIIVDDSYQWIEGTLDSRIIQYQLDAPCFHVGPPIGTAGQTIEAVVIDGLYLRHAGTGTATTDGAGGLVGGHGLELTGAFMCTFSRLQIGDVQQGASGATSVPYTGVYCDPRSGTIPVFSCSFKDIRIKNFAFCGWHQFRNAYDAATGNTYENIYISAGGGGDIRDLSSVGGYCALFGSLAQSSFDQLNLEWSAMPRVMHLEVCRSCTFQSLNIEGITLKASSLQDQGLVSLYQSKATINGAMIQNCTFSSANNVQNPSFFRLQDMSELSLDTFYPILCVKSGISNLALVRNFDAAGNQGVAVNLSNLTFGDSDQLDLVDGFTFSTGNDGHLFGTLADFNNGTPITLSNANATHYVYRKPGIIMMAPSGGNKTVTLSRQISSTIATRIPRGVVRKVFNSNTSAASNILVQNYQGTNLANGTTGIAFQAAMEFTFDGTNWIRSA